MIITGALIHSHTYNQGYDGEISWINKKTGKKDAFRTRNLETGMFENYVSSVLVSK